MSDLGQLATLQLNMLCIIIIICEYLVAQGKELAQVGLSKFTQLSALTRVGETQSDRGHPRCATPSHHCSVGKMMPWI